MSETESQIPEIKVESCLFALMFKVPDNNFSVMSG